MTGSAIPASAFGGQDRRCFTRVALAVLTVIVPAAVALGAAGWLAGWRTHTMTTPSMGRHGQVGSVIISRPVSAASIRPGDVLAFHPPGRPNVTFVHRVISVIHTAAGPQFHTKGDINGAPDSWTLTGATIIGRAVLRIPDAGFLLQMMPLLLCGAFMILLLTHTQRTRIKTPARILCGSLLAAALLVIYRPLDRVDLIGQVRNGNSGHAAIVPTGVLPVRVKAFHGNHVDLTPGQVGSVVSHLSGEGAFRIVATVHLQGWWWLLLAVWAVPLAVAVACRNRIAQVFSRVVLRRHPGAHRQSALHVRPGSVPRPTHWAAGGETGWWRSDVTRACSHARQAAIDRC